MMVALIALMLFPAAAVQAAATSRHLDRAPEELMKEALALETLISWSERCLSLRGGSLRFVEDALALREQLRSLAGEVFNGTALLTLGGIHLRALQLLLNGSDEVTTRTVEDVLKLSLRSLVRSGVPYHEVEDFFRNPVPTPLFRFYSRVSSHLTRVCAEELLLRLLSFVVYLERGNVLKARAVAEEVLTERSMFFGLAMMLVLEGVTQVGRRLSPASDRDLPEHVLAELISALKELNVDVAEVLSRYSLAELIELYEDLGGVRSLAVVLNSSHPQLAHPLRAGVAPPLEGLEEESLAREVLGDRSRGPRDREGEEVGTSSEEPPGFEMIAELVGRIPPRVTSSAASLVGAASYRSPSSTRQVGAATTPRLATNQREPGAAAGGAGLLAYVLAASAASAATLLLLPRGRSDGRSRERRLPLVLAFVGVERPNPVVEAFWSLVRALSAERKVEILPSDTHREVVGKLEARLDDVSSALLRRLCKLYEVVRFSREVPEGLATRELEALRELMRELLK